MLLQSDVSPLVEEDTEESARRTLSSLFTFSGAAECDNSDRRALNCAHKSRRSIIFSGSGADANAEPGDWASDSDGDRIASDRREKELANASLSHVRSTPPTPTFSIQLNHVGISICMQICHKFSSNCKEIGAVGSYPSCRSYRKICLRFNQYLVYFRMEKIEVQNREKMELSEYKPG